GGCDPVALGGVAAQTLRECLTQQTDADKTDGLAICHGSTEWGNAEVTRGRRQAVAQRLGHRDAVFRAVLPRAVALLGRQPRTVAPGQALSVAQGAHRGIDLAFEYRRWAKCLDRQRDDGVPGICSLARFLDEIDDLAAERRLVERAG